MVRLADPKGLEVHPLNEALVPPMRPEEFEALALDVAERGVQVPLMLLAKTNQVVDGRNRLVAALEAGLDRVPVRELDMPPEELPLYVLSRVAVHRHLAAGQKAALAAEYADALIGAIGPGRPAQNNSVKCDGISGERRQVAARRFGIANSYVQLALNLKALAPESFSLLKHGEISIQEAQAVVARVRVERASDQLVPEIKRLCDSGRLAPEAAWHLSQLTLDEQKVLLELLKEEGMAALNGSAGRTMKVVMKKVRDDEEWQRFQEELLALREEKGRLEVDLAAARALVNQYVSELEGLQPKMEEAVGEASPEVAARMAFLDEELGRLGGEKGRLEAELSEIKDLMNGLHSRYLEEKGKREELENECRHLRWVIERAREIVDRKRERGRRRREIYEKELERMGERLERAKVKARQLRDEKHKLEKVIRGLSHKVVSLAARREHLQTVSALRTLIGIWKGPELRRLPRDILLNEGDVVGALELLNDAIGAMEELLTQVNEAAGTLFSKLQVVEVDDEAGSQEALGSETSGGGP